MVLYNLLSTDTEAECWSISIAGRQEFHCSFQTHLVSVRCSFDGGEPENCSLPLVVDIERFSTESHAVNVTVTDELDQLWELTFDFKLAKCEHKPRGICPLTPAFHKTESTYTSCSIHQC